MSKNDGQKDPSTTVDTRKQATQKHVIQTPRRNKRPVLLYSSIFVMLLSVISIGYYQPSGVNTSTTGVASVESKTAGSQSFNKIQDGSVDQKLATDIAAAVAVQAKMPIAANVTNLAVSLEAQKDMVQTDNSTVAKPQIIQPTSDNRSITTYKAKAGDTVESIAAANDLQPDTVRWANNLASDNVEPGRDIIILPVDGVVYTVKDGDTIQSIAARYKSTADRIVAYNDLEVNGIAKDAQLIVPGGILPETERPGYVAPSRSPVSDSRGSIGAYTGGVNFSNVSASVGNRYAFGNCTWYAFERRAQLGRPIGSFWGNASSWAASGRAAGFAVDGNPEPGAIAQWDAYGGQGIGYAGHVGVVESVNPDGTVTISEMNYAGFNQVTRRTFSADRVSHYIH